MVRIAYLALGFISLLFGAVGIVLPLLPTVPFVLLAAFFFARSSPRLERWLVDHPSFGPHISAWRTRRAISRKGKRAALACFAASALLSLFLLPLPWSLAPLAAAVVGGSWIATRASA
jgi:uncharacterized membrane protein YbaN (DUF454 family)